MAGEAVGWGQRTAAPTAPNSRGDNKELARDLASFAVDGGTLIIGVQENKESRTFELAPQPLNGLPEKIEQVARTLPDPPLTVITEEISSAADTSSEGSGAQHRLHQFYQALASPLPLSHAAWWISAMSTEW
ncbi:hypothetical protein ACFVJ8_34185 [Streptomyces yangpuensis]|uniref:hypothetical protein n=1 Tax=Streptomyces yangpuensis TaxID=1648182 RepID=UPI00362BE73F